MAKEEVHKWSRTLVTVLSIVFFCGITYRDVGTNAEDIDKVEVKVDKNTVGVHELELNAKDIENIAVKSAEAFTDIKVMMTTIQKTQSDQATIQAVNSAKLESLTKD